MTSDQQVEATSTGSSASFPAGLARKEADNSRSLARRIAGWTGNLVATAAVLLVALVVGRKLTWSWGLDAPPRSATATRVPVLPANPFDNPQSPIELSFGEAQFAIHRQPIRADRDGAVSALLAMCRDELSTAVPSRSITPGERRLLARLGAKDLVESIGEDGKLYESSGTLPMIVGTKTAPATSNPAAGAGRGTGSGESRVVTWGLAVPLSENAWTLYAFSPGGPAAGGESDVDTLPAVPLPAGAKHVMTVRIGGRRMTVIKGRGTDDDWPRFFDGWFAEQGWSTDRVWAESAGVFTARYRNLNANESHTALVQFGKDGQHGLRGVLSISSRNQEP